MRSRSSRRTRCAVYTRKSSEEGLEQDFNSLDAQREACLAYIQSQKSEGWKPVRARYDDGGFSGGNVERPALAHLLSDIEAGKIDTVVVYKVDRLTRSLTDFARIVDVMDAASVSFVSVTQQFNTTTSMGRLTLNMLLSFAQFEREVTGERIRDKIAASKRKGLWMGGRVPLGYAANGRTLEIKEKEAATVRRIYDLYLKHRSVTLATEEINRLGLKTKSYVDKKGRRTGNKRFSRGHAHRVLSNPLYAGRIAHKGETYDGQHPAIIDPLKWERVQSLLREKAPAGALRAHTSPLRGKVFDENGAPLTPSHTVKSGRRYRYYVSKKSASPVDGRVSGTSGAWRLPAGELEALVSKAVCELIRDDEQLRSALRAIGLSSGGLAHAFEAARGWLQDPFSLVARIEVEQNQLAIQVDTSCFARRDAPPIPIHVPTRLARRGTEKRLVSTDTSPLAPGRLDPALAKAIARARSWFESIASGRVTSFAAIATEEGVSDQYVGKLMPLAFLSPAIVEAVLSGDCSVELTAEALTSRIEIPATWTTQESMLRP
ncbi:MAG: recombinase family protein [Deltaproteobacteria bacterium]|jgi:DNA invertase Pin-like site-specific DNA recombinase|nr:recombinase family protein [Deltaproteobacteria bacterium]